MPLCKYSSQILFWYRNSTAKQTRVARALDINYSNDEYRDIFHKSDADENGVIDIDEFITTFENDFSEEG